MCVCICGNICACVCMHIVCVCVRCVSMGTQVQQRSCGDQRTAMRCLFSVPTVGSNGELCYQVHAANDFDLLSHVTILTLLFKTFYNSRHFHIKRDHHREYRSRGT